jgi:hypothetical protein
VTDIPQGLAFVDPDETDDTYRCCLWAAPGQGKSVAAASAPGPILAEEAEDGPPVEVEGDPGNQITLDAAAA